MSNLELVQARVTEGNGILKKVESMRSTNGIALNVVYFNAEDVDNCRQQITTWQLTTKEVLISIYGESHRYVRDFSKTISSKNTGFNFQREFVFEIKQGLSILDSVCETINLGIDKKHIAKDYSDNNKVFIVHGHDSEIRNEVELLVKQLELDPVVLFKRPNLGDTIIEKLLREANEAAFAIVIYTKCDEGKAIEDRNLKPRARQNVVFEHGLMCGLLGRNRVVALVEEGVEIPSDLSGIVYIQLDESKRWQFDIAKEMKAAGLNIDLNKLL